MLWQLFSTFFRIGLFSFGGGYAMLSMIQQEVVMHHKWLTNNELTDMIAISQMTPGPIAINAATFIGYRQAGFWGSAVTTIGVVLPSVILMTVITMFYLRLKGKVWFNTILTELRPLVIGLIAAAAVMAARTSLINIFSISVFIICYLLSLRYKLHPILLMFVSGMAGVILT